jgi:RimJ/RimL family protein N-acetyltransferase
MNTPDVSSPVVRPVRPAEVDALRALRIESLRCCPVAFTADLGEAETRSLDAWRDQVTRGGGDETELILVAVDGDQLAAMTGVWAPKSGKCAHVGTVWGVYVRAPFRGRGLAEQLLLAGIEWARTKGLLRLKLSVVEGNDLARRCYERCGFTAYGIEPAAVRWEGRLYDEVLMGREV